MPIALDQPNLAQAIKQATQSAHEAVERLLLPKLTGISSLYDYGSILKMFYGFFHPLEEGIQRIITAGDLPDIKSRRTAYFLKEDLAAIGSASDTIPVCDSLPKITNKAEAFGAMYVMEGSSLGGRMIAKMLGKNEVVSIPSNALNFFSGYKEATGERWTLFLAALNSQQDVETVTEAANETFLHLKNWMTKSFMHG